MLNKFNICNDITEILAFYKGKQFKILIDTEDLYKVNSLYKHSLRIEKKDRYLTYYATGIINGNKVPLHRFIMNCPKGLVVDHIDHNGLNNTKSNLRNVTIHENLKNKLNKADNYILQFLCIDDNKYLVYFNGIKYIFDSYDKAYEFILCQLKKREP